MKKGKSFWLILVFALLLGSVGGYFVWQNINDQTQVFAKDGYVVVANDQAESSRYSFVAKTSYKKKYPDQFSFQDVKSQQIEVRNNSFLHYEDGSASSLSDGVFIHLDDMSSKNAINHYHMPSGMILEKSGNGFSISSRQETLKVNEVIWKNGDNTYMVLAKSLKVYFNDKDIREVKGYIEVRYIDEGVVQLVSEDNVWQSVSPKMYIQTAAGAKLKLKDQVIEYKDNSIPLTKMVIEADDNVKLSPLEVRNQQVPEFAVDTKDGDEGNQGTNGEEGSSGSEGSNGKKGSLGSGGNLGNGGDNGNQGNTGTSGGSGSGGDTGTTGSNGKSKEDGANGNDGTGGKKGGSGNNGMTGSNGQQNSSAKTGLPQMSIEDWNITATSVSGKINITDENLMLSSKDAMKVVIYEAGSGEEIAVVDGDGKEEIYPTDAFSFKNATVLQPDTEYRFIVSAKYEMNDQTYEREFVSRVFYTDSLGVLMEKREVLSDQVSIHVTKKDYSTSNKATLYLLTKAETANFDPNRTEGYTNTPIGVPMGDDYTEGNYTFKDLPRNTAYTVRMVLEINGKKYLTQQAMQVTTLKKAPVMDSASPYVINNISIHGFELYGGMVADEDHAMLSRYYEIYDCDDASDRNGEMVKSIEVDTGTSQKASILYIDNDIIKPNHKYKFRSHITYSDNEKVIEVVGKYSNVFSMGDAQLPALSFRKDSGNYDYFKGNLYIDKNKANMDITPNRPLKIFIDCEGMYKKEITITSLTSGSIHTTETQIIIPIDESGLKANQTYRLRVTGYVDLKDGASYQLLEIGNVVQTTNAMTKLSASWTDAKVTSSAISKVLRFKSTDNAAWNADSYDAKTLSKVIVELYSGSGTSKVYLGTSTYEDTDSDPHTSSITDKFINEGIEINETTFGLTTSQITQNTYTFRVSNVYDYTSLKAYNNPYNVSKYINSYEINASTQEYVVSKMVQPPTLPNIADMNVQVNADPIYNQDAATYGLTKDTSLTDDAIIGYRLKSNYDNFAKLARKISFYVFESKAYQQVTETDKVNPIWDDETGLVEDGTWLKKIDVDIQASSVNVPVVAVIFGKGSDKVYNGINIRFAGETEMDGEMPIAGMSRGFKYVFAYTLGYNPTGAGSATTLYPYQHPKYNEISKGTPFVLNSGIKAAPKVEPSFYSYVNYLNGPNLEMRFQYIDRDETITVNKSEVQYANSIQTVKVKSGEWQTYTFNNITEKICKPMINRSLYTLNYKEEKNASREMFSVPMDNDDLLTSQQVNQFSFNVNADMDNNLVRLRINGGSVLETSANKRLVGVYATFIDTDNAKKSFSTYLPLNESYSASCTTALLADAGLMGKTIEVKATLYYVTGLGGWRNVTANSNFAIRTYKSDSVSNYMGYNSISTANAYYSTAQGSLYRATSSFSEEQLAQSNPIININALMANPAKSFSYLMVKTQNGIAIREVSSGANENMIIPRNVASSSLASSGNNTFTLARVTPSASANKNYVANLESVDLKDVNFVGTDEIDVEADGKQLAVIEAQNRNVQSEVITQSIDVSKWQVKDVTLLNLKKGNTYDLRVKAKIDGRWVYLLDIEKPSSQWTMSVSTLGELKIYNAVATYRPDSYGRKTLYVRYDLNQTRGFVIEYRILDDQGYEVLSNQEMIAAKYYNGYSLNQSYVQTMSAYMNLYPVQDKLTRGKNYKIEIKAFQVKDGVKGDELGLETASFSLPVAKNPSAFIDLVPHYESKKISMDFAFTIGDKDAAVMSDYTENDPAGVYFARIYKQVESGWEDVTPDPNEKYAPGTPYKITLENLESNKNYRLVIYMTIDKDGDGIADQKIDALGDIKGSIASIDEQEFEKYKNDFILNESIGKTPGSDGISFGDTSIENPNGDTTRISVAYKNASGLSSVAKIDYAILSADGTQAFTGSMFAKDQENATLFKEKASGYYTLTFPVVLEVKGKYAISVYYYVKEGDDYNKLDSTYSSIYLY